MFTSSITLYVLTLVAFTATLQAFCEEEQTDNTFINVSLRGCISECISTYNTSAEYDLQASISLNDIMGSPTKLGSCVQACKK